MLSCKAKENEVVVFDGEFYTVVETFEKYCNVENYLGDMWTTLNDFILIKGIKCVARRAEDISIPF
jgi:hypothetical protein